MAPTKCVSNPATSTTLCGPFLKCSFTEEHKKYRTGPALLISGRSTPQVTVCQSTLSFWLWQQGKLLYVTADSCSSSIPTSPSQAIPVTLPEIWDRKDFPSPSSWCLLWTCCPRVSLMSHETPTFVSLHSLLWQQIPIVQYHCWKKKRIPSLLHCKWVFHSYGVCGPALNGFVGLSHILSTAFSSPNQKASACLPSLQ